jgi:hypothetical protein
MWCRFWGIRLFGRWTASTGRHLTGAGACRRLISPFVCVCTGSAVRRAPDAAAGNAFSTSGSSVFQRILPDVYAPVARRGFGVRNASTFKVAYEKHVAERAAMGIVPKPINAQQMAELAKLLQDPPKGEEAMLLDLITNRVPPGVDEAAYVKADFLTAIVKGKTKSPLIDATHAVKLLGTMQGGYNVNTLIEALEVEALAPTAAAALKHTCLVFDAFYDVEAKVCPLSLSHISLSVRVSNLFVSVRARVFVVFVVFVCPNACSEGLMH